MLSIACLPQPLYVVLVILILGLISNTSLAVTREAPCWFETLVEGEKIGQVGVARALSAGGMSPRQLARLRAVQSLCAYLGRECSTDMARQAASAESLFEKPLFFDSFDYSGSIYVYASFAEINAAICKTSSCAIAECKPQWLCKPAAHGVNGILGVSYVAALAFEQYQLAVANALLQAEYLYGVQVSAQKNLRQSRIGGQHFSILTQAGDIDIGERESLPYYVSHQCRNESTLYRRVVLAAELKAPISLQRDDLGWVTNPKYLGLDGAVGSIDKPVGSGLLSDQIELAIQRAAIQLAFEKSSDVSAESITATSSHSGQILISSISENTRAELKARVAGIHFQQGVGGFLEVHVWLVIVP